jgi:hypothetical protein
MAGGIFVGDGFVYGIVYGFGNSFTNVYLSLNSLSWLH